MSRRASPAPCWPRRSWCGRSVTSATAWCRGCRRSAGPRRPDRSPASRRGRCSCRSPSPSCWSPWPSRLLDRRDVGAGLLPSRPGPATAAPGLAGVRGLAWPAAARRGAVVGTRDRAARRRLRVDRRRASATSSATTRRSQDVIARRGGSLVDSFLATSLLILSLVAAAFAVQSALRLRGEEPSPVGARRSSPHPSPGAVGGQPPRRRVRGISTGPRGRRCRPRPVGRRRGRRHRPAALALLWWPGWPTCLRCGCSGRSPWRCSGSCPAGRRWRGRRWRRASSSACSAPCSTCPPRPPRPVAVRTDAERARRNVGRGPARRARGRRRRDHRRRARRLPPPRRAGVVAGSANCSTRGGQHAVAGRSREGKVGDPVSRAGWRRCGGPARAWSSPGLRRATAGRRAGP